jgi:hypothetical protein
MKLKSIFFACALLAACGGPTAENVATSGRAVSWPLSEVPYFNGPVTVYDSGHWRIIRGCSGFCVSTYKMWIDLAVRNDAFHKVVGIRYTSDGWHSHRDVYAQYEGQLQNGYERWGIELERSTGISMPPDIEYAAFVEMNGRRFWDERNNHYVYKGVTPKRPVRVVESGVTYDATDGAVLSGRVRALPLAADRQVTVRYTTDGWATWKDADAQVAGTTPSDKNDFTFRVSGLGKTTLPEQVTFAVRYRSGGLEYWDNNDKQDYSFQLAPEFRSSSTASLEGPVQGRFTVSGSYSTHLAIERIQYRLDGGHWIDEAKAQIVTDAMNDGSHRLEFRVTLEGGYQQTDNVDFTVRNRIQIVDSWQLTYNGDPVGANWEMDVDSQGRTFTLPFSLPGQSPTPIIRARNVPVARTRTRGHRWAPGWAPLRWAPATLGTATLGEHRAGNRRQQDCCCCAESGLEGASGVGPLERLGQHVVEVALERQWVQGCFDQLIQVGTGERFRPLFATARYLFCSRSSELRPPRSTAKATQQRQGFSRASYAPLGQLEQ